MLSNHALSADAHHDAASLTRTPSVEPQLLPGYLHEVHVSAQDWGAALAFVLASFNPEEQRPILLARSAHRSGIRMQLHAEGLMELGIDPGRLLIVEVRSDPDLLRVALDAARCPALAATVLESWGNLPLYDLTASRRLVLAAERSRVPVIMLRGEAKPRASAAYSRWQISSAPSTPLAANAPGTSSLQIELLRKRGGPAGMCWQLEWNDEYGYQSAKIAHSSSSPPAPPLSGTVVPFPPLRASAAHSRAA